MLYRSIVLLACVALSVSVAPARQKHKSEDKIARMTPAQRVDEWVNEDVHHRFDVLDEHSELIFKYIRQDGLKALPRLIEIMDEYDPTRYREGKGRRGERFTACVLMLGTFDGEVVRLRASEEGRRAIDALERGIERMRRAGYADKDQIEFKKHLRYESALDDLQRKKGINFRDEAIQQSFRLEYKILLSDEDLLAFTNSLMAQHPEYPAWSRSKLIKDPALKNEAGYPLQFNILETPDRFHKAYLEFKKANP